MPRFWEQFYPENVPTKINTEAYETVVDMIETAMERYKDKTAFHSLSSSLTFGEVDKLSRDFAAFLQTKLNLKKGDRVAMMTPNLLAFPVAMMGVMRAGGVQVNINPLYTATELTHQLNDAGVEAIVIYGGSTATLVKALGDTSVKSVITVDMGDCTGEDIKSPEADPGIPNPIRFMDALAEGAQSAFTHVELSRDDMIYLQYTAGTTGFAKGAVLRHRNLIANSEQFKAFAADALRPGKETVITALPLYHIFALTLNLLSYFSVGAKNVLIANPRDMGEFMETMKKHPFSVITGVNTLFGGMLQHPEFGKLDFSNYRVAIGGGAPVLSSTSEKWRKITGADILEGYGLSETSPILTLNPMGKQGFSGKVGMPLPETEIKLLRDDGTEAPRGEPGEVCARGPQVMSGYWNRDDANAESFTADGFFRTGDIGVFDDEGYLSIVDRKKDMILVSGPCCTKG